MKTSFFIRNLAVVMTGTAAAQAITFLFLPIVSRIYSPSDFGVWGALVAIAQVLSIGSTLQLQQSVVIAKRMNEAFHLLCASIVSVVVVSLLLLVVLLFFPWLYTFPYGSFFYGLL